MKLLCVLNVFWLLLSGRMAAIQAALKPDCSNEMVPSVCDLQTYKEYVGSDKKVLPSLDRQRLMVTPVLATWALERVKG